LPLPPFTWRSIAYCWIFASSRGSLPVTPHKLRIWRILLIFPNVEIEAIKTEIIFEVLPRDSALLQLALFGSQLE
jgi:hypothetical protein